MLTLEQLQQRTRDLWVNLHDVVECYYSEADGSFETELATYGDPAERSTWEQCYCHLKAKFFAETVLEDGQFLIEFYLYVAPKREGWLDLVPSVLQHLLEIPSAVTALEYGYRAIKEYGCEYGADLQSLEEICQSAMKSSNGLHRATMTKFALQSETMAA